MPGLVSPESGPEITDLAAVIASSLVRDKICENMPVVDWEDLIFVLVPSGSAGFSPL